MRRDTVLCESNTACVVTGWEVPCAFRMDLDGVTKTHWDSVAPW
jgi:hypothetical protein